MSATTADGDRSGGLRSRTGLLLAVCCVAQFLVILDLSIVIVALPEIQSGLRIPAADLQWVVEAYAVVFAGFLMLAGRVADVFGHRRTFLGALVVFALASLLGGLAQSTDVLLVARGLQGLAGAGMAAASLAIITASFAAGPERIRAIGLWGAMNGLGGAAGLLLGGILTELLSWRWVLLVNVPIAVAAVVLAAAVVTERRTLERKGFDVLGALLLTAGLLVAIYGGVTAGSEGWSSADALVPIAIGNVLLGAFVLVEKRFAKAPLIPPGTLKGQLGAINLIVLLFSAAVFSMWFVGSLYMQQVLALTALETGLAFLPMALTIFLTASQAGKLVGRVGVRPVLGGGLILMTGGLGLFGLISDGGSAIQYIVLPGVLTATGIGLAVVASTIAATQHATAGQAGLSSALVNTARQVGGGLGLAVLVSIATQETAGLIGDGNPVAESLTDGFRLAYLVGAGLAGLAAVLTFALLAGARPATAPTRIVRRLVPITAVVVAGFSAVAFALPRSEDAPIGTFTKVGAHSFVSAPDLHPPKLNVEIPESEDDELPGLIMAANFYDLTKAPMVGQSGPMMLDADLQPVWFKPVPDDSVAANLEVHELDGKPVLAWWEGDITETGDVSEGEIVVVDDSYQEIARLKGQDGWILTLHELVIEDGVAWVTASKNIRADLSEVGGVSNGVLIDSGVQRYDLKTGELLSTWKATDHLAFEESEAQAPPNGFPWDAYHINSIDLTDDGRMLLSFRNTSAGYMVDVASGEIEWRLGGTRSDFAMEESARFEWQHDLRLRPDGTITLFDNHCCEITGAGEFLPATGPSRAMTLKLDEAAGTATMVRELSHGPTFRAQYMGNAQPLDDGGALVGWGQVPYISRYDADGELTFDGTLPTPNLTYRAYVQPWVGRPADPPRCAVAVRDGRAVVMASWNGATQVATWRVVAGAGGEGAERLAQAPKDGFETTIDVPDGSAQMTVRALDEDGATLGSCSPTRAR